MASYHRNSIKEDESDISEILRMKGTDSEQNQLHCSLQKLLFIIIIFTAIIKGLLDVHVSRP